MHSTRIGRSTSESRCIIIHHSLPLLLLLLLLRIRHDSLVQLQRSQSLHDSILLRQSRIIDLLHRFIPKRILVRMTEILERRDEIPNALFLQLTKSVNRPLFNFHLLPLGENRDEECNVQAPSSPEILPPTSYPRPIPPHPNSQRLPRPAQSSPSWHDKAIL